MFKSLITWIKSKFNKDCDTCKHSEHVRFIENNNCVKCLTVPGKSWHGYEPKKELGTYMKMWDDMKKTL